MAVIEGTNTLGISTLGHGTSRRLVVEYDSAVDVKTAGEVTLRGGALPSGALIVDSLVHIKTKLESGGSATVLLSAQSEGDIQASKLVSEAPWSTATPKRGAVTATGTPIVTTAEKSIVAKIGTATLTAGKFIVVIEYLVIG